jgi:hypothetical protein
MINAINEQLELGFNPDSRHRGVNGSRHARRIARASWWFARMREVVEQAMDWTAVGEPRPEQIWIPGATREVDV